MKYIITEDQYDRIYILRRGDAIRDFVKYLYPSFYPCDYRKEDFIYGILMSVNDVDYDWGPKEPSKDEIKSFILTFMKDELEDFWETHCGEKQ
jgi:hypothetical protein